MKSQVEWKAKNGQTLSAIVELVASETIYTDGQNVEVKCCKIEVDYNLDGKHIASGRPMKAVKAAEKMGFSHTAGKIGMTIETYELVKSAIDEVEQAPEWQAKIETGKKAEKELCEYEQHVNRVNEMMAE